MEVSKKIFIDTNSLIYHTFENFDSKKYHIIKGILNTLIEKNYSIYISTQILKEFFAISTNQKFFDEPLTIEEAILKLNEFKTFFNVLNEDNHTITILETLISKYTIKKQKVYDTNIVAIMLQNNIDVILTWNIKDFKNFKEIKIFALDKKGIK